MPEIKFDTGLVTYNLNGKCEVSFNPTDVGFAERLFETFDILDKQQDDYTAEIKATDDNRRAFNVARKWDTEMRACIDGVFGQPVCDVLFGSMNVYAFSDGLPVWCNLMLAIMDVIDTSFAKEQQATNPRIQKYTAKYKKT